jgi:hypothetical protein
LFAVDNAIFSNFGVYMGEAKRKREAEKSEANIEQQRAAVATQQVVAAITDYGGADCFLYAHIGAGLLKSLGLDAKVVVGSAAWRIGDSDGATVCHAREIQCPQNRQPRGLDCVKGGFFHVWIEAPNLIIDFSTNTLKAKAETLDAIDGIKTEIKWAPEFIWYRRSVQDTYDYKMLAEPRKVIQSPHAGVCCYIRHADIDEVAIEKDSEFSQSMGQFIFAAQAAYSALERGEKLKIFGIGEDGIQSG